MDDDLVYLDLDELASPITCEGPDCHVPATWSISHVKCGHIVYTCSWHTMLIREEQRDIKTIYRCTRCGDFGLPRILFTFTQL